VSRPGAAGRGASSGRYWYADLLPLAGPDGAIEFVHCIVEDVDRPGERTRRLRMLWDVEGVGVTFYDREGDGDLGERHVPALDGAAPPARSPRGGLSWRTFTPA